MCWMKPIMFLFYVCIYIIIHLISKYCLTIITKSFIPMNLVPEFSDQTIEGKSISYVFLGSSLAGCFTLSDVCRGGVREALQELKSMGIRTAMLTGDCYTSASHAQDEVSIQKLGKKPSIMYLLFSYERFYVISIIICANEGTYVCVFTYFFS